MLDRQVACGVLMVLLSLCTSCHQDTAPTGQVDNVDTESSGSQESEGTVIPLKDIWAFEMRGTRDIRLLGAEEGQNFPRQALVRDIQRRLYDRPDSGPKPGFVVQGSGAEALREVHSVLVDGKTPRESFLAGSDISLVFFSYQASAYVQLEEVEIEGHTIRIVYSLQQHMTANVTEHFAVIPLGRLPAGEVEVEIDWSDAAETQEDPNNRIACVPFSFTLID